ncbi:AraC family transcriptional regulator [Candidatus Binatia bacterium]|jgi:AraC-like DNA-binding protein|nr:AraC family transcriptional regulator [Candidatus Binatia bacterium]
MRAVPLIRAASSASMVRFLASIGAPVARAWERAGLPPAALGEPEHVVPLRSLGRFVDDCAHTQGIDELGLRSGEQTSVEMLGTFGAAVRRASTLGDALRTSTTAVASYSSVETFWVSLHGDRARFCQRFSDPSVTSRHIDLFSVGVIINLLRLTGDDWTPSRIELQSAGPRTLREPGLVADAEIVTGSLVTGVEFPRALLHRRLVPPPATVMAPSPTGLTEWQRTAPPRDFLRSFEVLLGSLLQTDRADVHTAADTTGLTVRSLQRRLAACGWTYSDLLDDLRRRTALRMLEDPSTKIIDVAVALGYSDAAHFTRAFHRWCGMSPIAYRRALRGVEEAAAGG